MNLLLFTNLAFVNLVFANPEESVDQKPPVIFSGQIPLYVHFNEIAFEDLANAELAYIRAKGKKISDCQEYQYVIGKRIGSLKA